VAGVHVDADGAREPQAADTARGKVDRESRSLILADRYRRQGTRTLVHSHMYCQALHSRYIDEPHHTEASCGLKFSLTGEQASAPSTTQQTISWRIRILTAENQEENLAGLDRPRSYRDDTNRSVTSGGKRNPAKLYLSAGRR
jgi:hypothetical protein